MTRTRHRNGKTRQKRGKNKAPYKPGAKGQGRRGEKDGTKGQGMSKKAAGSCLEVKGQALEGQAVNGNG